MVLFFQYVNLQYLELFKQANFANLTGSDLDDKITANIDTYKSINLLGIIFSATLMGSQVMKILFNLFSDSYIPNDKWSKMEFLSAVVNIMTFMVLSNLQPGYIKDTNL